MPAPLNNTNGAKARVIRDQMMYCLDHYEDSMIERGLALRAICMKQVEKAIEGDVVATQVIFDRVEGKATQAIEVDNSGFTIVINQLAQASPKDITPAIDHIDTPTSTHSKP